MALEDSVAFEKACCLDTWVQTEEFDRRDCEEEKCKLVEFDALPDYLKDNEFIIGYYRCEWPLKQTILSIFSVHNETLNVWTHLIGFIIFLSLTALTAMMIPRDASITSEHSSPAPANENGSSKAQSEAMSSLSLLQSAEELQNSLPSLSNWQLPGFLISCLPKISSQDNNHTNPCLLKSVKDDMANMMSPLLVQPITRWPFFAFLCGAMFCLLTSSICHLMLCHSKRTAYIMLRLDYAGISALIVTSFFPLVYYSFMCDPFYCNLYIGSITAFGASAVSASLVPAFQAAEFRPVRAGLFFCMGVSGVVPIMHKLMAFGSRPEAVVSAGYELLMGAFYGVGVVVYTARVPERWMPGKFDLVGHSHQLFHVLVIAGAYAHYLAGLVYLKWRDVDRC